EGVTDFDEGDRVLLNPGLADGTRILGEHMDGTHTELSAVPAEYVHPIPEGMTFEEAAAFPLVYVTAHRMLATRAGLREGEWVLVWGIGSGVAVAALGIAKALGARVLVTSTSDEKLERALALGADAAVRTDADVVAEAKRLTDGAGMDVVVEHIGEATWRGSRESARNGGRIWVCGATSGPNPPAMLHRIFWKQLSILGSTMGTRQDFAALLELVESGRVRPVVYRTFPLRGPGRAHRHVR